MVATTSIKLPLAQFMQCLEDLTNVRDHVALDNALLALMQHWIALFADQAETAQLSIFRQRDIVSNLMLLNAHDDLPTEKRLSFQVYEKLKAWSFVERRKYQSFQHEEGTVHFFPIANSLIYKQAALVIQHDLLDSSGVKLIEQCLHMFHGYTSLILENERDSLTGLLNRKRFDYSVSKIMLTHADVPNSLPLHHYLAIFDIDRFKRINDGFGHAIGDEVLLMLSQLMQKTFRERDLLFRFGGEEFVGIFSCANEEDIFNLLDRFRLMLAAFAFPQVGKVTISIGYARLTLDELPNVVLEHADDALYYAKEHGRDQVCDYEALKAAGLLGLHPIQGEIELF